MNQQNDWLSIIDYSQLSGLSISTLRRRIKRQQIEFQEIGGKYFIKCDSGLLSSKEQHSSTSTDEQNEAFFLRLHIEKIEKELHCLREENNDLRMLVEIYERENKESSTAHSPELPALPELPSLQ